jgi:hypothetical protein
VNISETAIPSFLLCGLCVLRVFTAEFKIMPEFIHGRETHALLGACFEVYKEKGCGFLEAVFQECLELELTDRDIPFRVQPALLLQYKGRLLRLVDLLLLSRIHAEDLPTKHTNSTKIRWMHGDSFSDSVHG